MLKRCDREGGCGCSLDRVTKLIELCERVRSDSALTMTGISTFHSSLNAALPDMIVSRYITKLYKSMRVVLEEQDPLLHNHTCQKPGNASRGRYSRSKSKSLKHLTRPRRNRNHSTHIALYTFKTQLYVPSLDRRTALTVLMWTHRTCRLQRATTRPVSALTLHSLAIINVQSCTNLHSSVSACYPPTTEHRDDSLSAHRTPCRHGVSSDLAAHMAHMKHHASCYHPLMPTVSLTQH
jgi:hypothetical protein